MTTITGDMLDYIKEETIENEESKKIKLTSVTRPTILLGWQVVVVVIIFLKCFSLCYFVYYKIVIIIIITIIIIIY